MHDPHGNLQSIERRSFLAGLASLSVRTARAQRPSHPSANSQREARLVWWREAKFGMFIHWGLYAFPAGEWKGKKYPDIGEWIMFKARIPIAEYEALAKQFNPTRFDADAWAQLAQDAGMRYLVITSKHHDGFAMFGSKVDRFNIVDATPFHRDPVKELAAACARRNIRFGVYYSQAQDWTAPGGAIWAGPHGATPARDKPRWDPRQEGDFDTYFDRKAIPQVRELLTSYGPISILWFDTPLNVVNVERASRLEKVVRDLQPDCLISGRLGGRNQSDYDSEGDNEIPNLSRDGAWETPATLNDTWGFKKDDHHWKRPEDVVFKLVDIVSKGGNYLLNVGPDAEGVIPAPSQEILRTVGRWVRANGDAIYGAGRSPFGAEFGSLSAARTDQKGRPVFEPKRDWRCTTKPGRLFIHIFHWPGTQFELTGVNGTVTGSYLLGGTSRKPLKVDQSGGTVRVGLPSQTPDPICSVICLEVRDQAR